MGWRKKMGIEQNEINSKPPIQKVQNIQKVEEKNKKEAFAPFAPFAPFALSNQNVKTCWNCSLLSLEDFPGLCKSESKLIPVSIIEKGCKQFQPDLSPLDEQITRLWNHAHRMADFTDSDKAPYEERKVLVPAIFSLGQTIDNLKEK